MLYGDRRSLRAAVRDTRRGSSSVPARPTSPIMEWKGAADVWVKLEDESPPVRSCGHSVGLCALTLVAGNAWMYEVVY